MSEFKQAMHAFLETIDMQWSQCCSQSKATVGDNKLMYLRGLLMLTHLQELEDFEMTDVALELVEMIRKVFEDLAIVREKSIIE